MTLKNYLQHPSSYLQALTSNIKLLFITLLFVCTPKLAHSQINEYYNFNNTIQAWTNSGNGSFIQSLTKSCDGIGSARANVYYNGINNFRSPLLGDVTADIVTVSFDYKVLDYYAHIPTLGDKLEIMAQWSNSTSGPWNTFLTINSENHIPSSSCLTKTASFNPTPGPLYVRFQNQAVGISTDIFFYYDNISIIEGEIPTCLPVQLVSVPTATIGTNSIIATWVPPTPAPALGYEYEVRTSGAAGSGIEGLAASGNVAAGINNAQISGLSLSTIYVVYVRGKCADQEFSTWRASSPIITLCGVETVPYSIPFSSAAVPGLPNCISIENVNGDNKFWKSYLQTSGIQGKVMQYSYSTTLPADDWFYTSALHLDAGTSYRLSFKYKTGGFDELLSVALGNSAQATTMTTILADISIPETTTDAVEQIIDFYAETSGTYYIGFQAHSEENQNSIFVGEVRLDFSPGCLPPSQLQVSNIDKNAATISWSPSESTTTTAYSYELRISGELGSGEEGLVDWGMVENTVFSKNLLNLEPSTEYTIYLSSVCGQNSSNDFSSKVFSTACNYPNLQAVNATVCLGTSAVLEISGAGEAEINWYETATSSTILESGQTFQTPNLTENTSYFVETITDSQNQIVAVGEGALLTDGYSNPLYSLWSNSHTQHLILASELHAEGIVAGEMSSVALTVTNIGNLPVKDLSIKIGMTTELNVENFVNNDDFATVFTSESFMPELGLNTFSFSAPYQWDGVSNIILEFCHGDDASFATMSREIVADATNFISTIKFAESIAVTGSESCSNTTENKSTYSSRPYFTFSANTGCRSLLRTEVVATVIEIPQITAEPIQTISVDALENATLAELDPSGDSVQWFASEEQALSLTDSLAMSTQVESGMTYYAVLSENDCHSLPFAVLVEVVLGMNSYSLNKLKYYPNPVQNQLSIQHLETIKSVKIFNLIGQQLKVLKPNSDTFKIDLSEFPAAVYLIEISTDSESKIIKIVKDKF